MNFLQLCQDVCRESGTFTGIKPAAVTGQTGREAKVVNWTSAAWQIIANRNAAWRWLRGEWSGALTAGTQRYSGASFSLTDHAEWIVGPRAMTIYKTSEGVADEGGLNMLDWESFRSIYLRGSQTAGRPTSYAVSPAGELCFGPSPDVAYTVRGEYRKTPQTLSADSDTPNMPARFHKAIVYQALVLLAENDEGFQSALGFRSHLDEWIKMLERDQLPTITFGHVAIA